MAEGVEGHFLVDPVGKQPSISTCRNARGSVGQTHRSQMAGVNHAGAAYLLCPLSRLRGRGGGLSTHSDSRREAPPPPPSLSPPPPPPPAGGGGGRGRTHP